MKVGQLYFHAIVDDDNKVSISEHVLRTIRGENGYLTEKVSGLTWVKRSSKTGDYGWADGIPDWLRHRFWIKGGLPSGYGLTKAAAIRSELANLRKSRARYKGEAEALAEVDADIATLVKSLKRYGKKT